MISAAPIMGLIKKVANFIFIPYFTINEVYTEKNTSSVITVAKAAPKIPYLGIKIKFKIMFNSATIPWLNALDPWRLIEDNVNPDMTFMNLKKRYQHNIDSTIAEEEYSAP